MIDIPKLPPMTFLNPQHFSIIKLFSHSFFRDQSSAVTAAPFPKERRAMLSRYRLVSLLLFLFLNFPAVPQNFKST